MAGDLRGSALAIQQLLMADARLCLESGLSPEEWHKRIRLLALYSLPPEHVEHRQDAQGNWLHRIKMQGGK